MCLLVGLALFDEGVGGLGLGGCQATFRGFQLLEQVNVVGLSCSSRQQGQDCDQFLDRVCDLNLRFHTVNCSQGVGHDKETECFLWTTRPHHHDLWKTLRNSPSLTHNMIGCGPA